jgi:uncharacterized paraquat-inducible protein A
MAGAALRNPMSSLESAIHVACPNCGALLVADGLPGGGNAICASCAHHFLFQPFGDTRRVSRKAVASLALGVVSLVGFCLTAIPGLILGGWALADIHRHDDRLRGRGVAISGIVLSMLFAFLSLFVWALLLPAIQFFLGAPHSASAPTSPPPGVVAPMADE